MCARGRAQVRIALHPQLLSDPHDWQLVWRQRLPGAAEQVASSADGRRLALSYRKLSDEAVSQVRQERWKWR